MKIYHHDPISGEYLNQGTALPDPMEQGKWLVPANATNIAPPKAQTSKVRVLKDGAWSQVADNRNTTYWLPDGTSHTITELGKSKPSSALDAPPPPTDDQLFAALRSKRDQMLEASDRTVLPDYPHANDTAKEAWLDYRQTLRDLPKNTTDPTNPQWPTAPSL